MRKLIITIAAALLAALALSVPALAGGYHYGRPAAGVRLDPNVPRPAHFPTGTWRPARNLPAGDPYICLYVNGSMCQKGNGSFNNVTIYNTSQSTWTFEQAGACSYCYMTLSSANNCQFETANADHGVQDGANPCSQSNPKEVWELFTGNGRCSMYNTGSPGGWYGTFHTSNGSSVEGWPVQPGFYTGWQISNYSC